MEQNKPFYDSSRTEKYLNKIVGSSDTYPQDAPRSRVEEYLKYLCEHGGGGGAGGDSIIEVDELPEVPDNPKALYKLKPQITRNPLPNITGEANNITFDTSLSIEETMNIIGTLDMQTVEIPGTGTVKLYAISGDPIKAATDIEEAKRTIAVLYLDSSYAHGEFTVIANYAFVRGVLATGDTSALVAMKVYFCDNGDVLSNYTYGMVERYGWDQTTPKISFKTPIEFVEYPEGDEYGLHSYVTIQNGKLTGMMWEEPIQTGLDNLYHYTNGEWHTLANLDNAGGIINVNGLPNTPDNADALYRVLGGGGLASHLPNEVGDKTVDTIYFNKNLTVDEFNNIVDGMDLPWAFTPEEGIGLKLYVITGPETDEYGGMSMDDIDAIKRVLAIMVFDLPGAGSFTLLTDLMFLLAVEGDPEMLEYATVYFNNNQQVLSMLTGGILDFEGWNPDIGDSITPDKPFIFSLPEGDEGGILEIAEAIVKNDQLGDVLYYYNSPEASSNLYHYTGDKWHKVANVSDIDTDMLTQVTYNELVSLRNSKKLVPGKQYRITDYVTTTAQEDTRSAGHQFDIIVTADDANKLNENARACLHKGDTYFSEYGAKLEAWELKYCLDNDKDRFVWADDSEPEEVEAIDINGEGYRWFYRRYPSLDKSPDWAFNKAYVAVNLEGWELDMEFHLDDITDWDDINTDDIIYVDNYNAYGAFEDEDFEVAYRISDHKIISVGGGKGVIYWMKDEWNNEAPYDFKNIMFVRGTEWLTYNENWCNNVLGYVPDVDKWFYTFTWENENYETFDLTLRGNFDLIGASEKPSGIYNNVIGPTTDYSNALSLSKNIIVCTYNYANGRCYGVYDNKFGNGSLSNTFGNTISNNTFGDYAESNVFQNEYYYNTFGHHAFDNKFGDYVESNVFGDGYQFNKVNGSDFYSNKFGIDCKFNTFEEMEYNTFGSDCSFNTITGYCMYNTFGDCCTYITFEDSIDYVRFENGVYMINNLIYSSDNKNQIVYSGKDGIKYTKWTENDKEVIYKYDSTNNTWELVDTDAQHIININATTSVGTYNCQFVMTAGKSKTFAQTSDIAAYLYAKKPNLRIPASGTYIENNVLYQVESIVASSATQVSVEMYNIADGTEKTVQTGAIDVIDTVL